MINLNKTTQKAQQILRAYNTSNTYGVNEAYAKPSTAKTRAEHLILCEMLDNGGYDYRITGANSCTFSCAYRIDSNLIYHTATNKYIIEGAF